jgi:hypothetical protein
MIKLEATKNIINFSKGFIFPVLLTFLFLSCEKDDFLWNLKKLPEVGYLSVVSNDLNEFELSAECTSIGYSENVEMGFCWSTNPNPSIEDNVIVIDKWTEGSFSVTIPWTNISTYHFRAYVKNELGIVYSQNCIVNWPGSPALPEVQTINTDQVSFYSFNVNCNVVTTGGNPVIQKGVHLYDNPSGSNPVSTIFSSDMSNSYSVSFNSLTDGTTYYVRAFTTTLAGTGFGNMLTVTLPQKFSVGEIGPAGGIIIYENPDPFSAWHYIEAAPIDVISSYTWAPASTSTGFVSIELGDGESNTSGIYSIHGPFYDYAAKAALNWTYGDYSDWCLPSFNELKLMKDQLYDQGLGNFSLGATYWSSSEDLNYSQNAWTVKMSGSGQNIFITHGKNQFFKVRAVRRF